MTASILIVEDEEPIQILLTYNLQAEGFRVRATAKTCYTRKNGLFVPQFEPLWEPALKRELKDPVSFTEYRRELLEQPETAQQYGRQLMRYVTGKDRG